MPKYDREVVSLAVLADADMRRLVRSFRTARGRAERERKLAEAAARQLAKRLSRRDPAELLHISYQRVQQLAANA